MKRLYQRSSSCAADAERRRAQIKQAGGTLRSWASSPHGPGSPGRGRGQEEEGAGPQRPVCNSLSQITETVRTAWDHTDNLYYCLKTAGTNKHKGHLFILHMHEIERRTNGKSLLLRCFSKRPQDLLSLEISAISQTVLRFTKIPKSANQKISLISK